MSPGNSRAHPVMKLSLVFENSGDQLPFEVVHNHELIEFFVDYSQQQKQNSFGNNRSLFREVEPKITHLHWAISKTNEVVYDLIGLSFDQNSQLEQYLDQNFLNKTHCDWVRSQLKSVEIDQLRHSINSVQARLGNMLHEQYPDEIRSVKIAAVLEKLGYIFPYEEINMAVHRLESAFNKFTLEFTAQQKWQVFENPYVNSMITNNDIVNFSFGYTYVGRQYYNKFVNFDTDLRYDDHYNYETLELAFQLNLSRPQTIPFGNEFLSWANSHKIKPVAEQIPIANLIDIDKNLFEYRKILFRNSRDDNRATIQLH